MNVLILSGFEANGFAGLLKDVQVANSIGVNVSAIATCQTAQSERDVLTVQTTECRLLEKQLASLSCQPLAIKIGLITNRETAETIAGWLSTLETKPFVVLDPVDLSSSNDKPLSNQDLKQRLEPLLPFVDLLTPNFPELETLTGQFGNEESAVQRFYQFKNFQGEVLVKGGHVTTSSSTVCDVLYDAHGRKAQWQQCKVEKQLRGTGCVLSTSVACAIADGYNLLDAITLASATLHHQFQTGRLPMGWPNNSVDLPVTQSGLVEIKSTKGFARLEHKRGLYPVVDNSEWIARLAATGIKTIQLRVKDQPETVVRQEIQKAIQIARDYNLQLFINDYWQLAIEYGAYGVHLGQEDIVDADVQKIQKAGLRLGISTHGDFEFLKAKQYRPSYLAVGAIFPTQTKDMTGQIQGLERLKRYQSMAEDIPVVAIGGIDESNLSEVLQTNVPMVAVVSAVTKASNPEQKAATLHREIIG